MLNTQKLLYILPDVAYLAELLPSKKPSTFTISSFRQINGEYMDENEFIAENILKLFNKIDPEEYQLILPDFLFTNTIVSVKEKSEAKIKEYLTKELLPNLDLSTDTHQIDTTILNEHGDSTRIQLSALEKSLLEPLQVSSQQTNVKIKSISPLSWSIKSLVSLEPSISVVQIDSMLYIALHYIGIDQASQATVEEVENIYETIKTLKGAEPSIQTIYLISNELVEEQLKEHLSDTLPIQQLATKQDETSKMPSYVKKIIESGMRTLSISDYPVPQFELGQAAAGAKIEVSSTTSMITEELTEEAAEESAETDPIEAILETNSDLPKPQKETNLKTESADGDKKIEIKETVEKIEPTKVVESIKPIEATAVAVTNTEKKDSQEDDEIEALLSSLKTDDNKTTKTMEITTEATAPKKIIKNKNRTKNMLKMVFVTLAVFFATVGIGIGIGLGVLKVTQPSSEEPLSPVVETSPSPLPSIEPSPSPEPMIDTASMSALVVNATTKAGYAGEIADQLTDFKTVRAGNAKGDYDSGTYIFMAENNAALIKSLETATQLDFTFQEKDKIEDPQDQYDVVIVLAR